VAFAATWLRILSGHHFDRLDPSPGLAQERSDHDEVRLPYRPAAKSAIARMRGGATIWIANLRLGAVPRWR